MKTKGMVTLSKSFNNLNALFEYLKDQVKDVMENEVGKEVQERTKKNIDKVIYGAGTPKAYDRTYQLRDSIKSYPAEVRGNQIIVEVDHDTSLIISDSENYQHGSKFYDPEDISEFIDEIIHEGLSGWLFGNGYWREERKYFDVTVDEFIQTGKHIQALKDGLKRRGIKAK